MPDDRSSVEFTLNPEAKFSDGTPITVDDVIFSYELLREHGRPNHRSYYKKVAKVEKTGERKVRFTFDADGDREMPLIMGLMPVLPKHLSTAETFEKTTLRPADRQRPLSRRRGEARPQHQLQAATRTIGAPICPVNRGRYNFDEIRFDYYRDTGSLFEAFKAGAIDARPEDDPTRWTEGYDFPALRDGQGRRRKRFRSATPAGMSALVFNTRRPLFADSRVREALIKLFDFEWVNRNLYHGQYARTESYFARSELSSHGRAADAQERALLAPYRGRSEARDHGWHLRLSRERRHRREPRRTASRRSPCSRRQATSSTRACSSTPRPANPSPSRSLPPRAPKNACCSPTRAP